MINRELETVSVLTYADTVDEYGQSKTGTPTTRNIQMVVHTVSQSNVQNPLYTDITLVGITEDKTLTDASIIARNNKQYRVRYITPGPKYNQVLLAELK